MMATDPQAASVLVARSPNIGPASASSRSGCSAPITVALATVVCCSAVKNNTMSVPNAIPPHNESRSSRVVTRPPVTRNNPVTRAAPIQSRYAAMATPLRSGTSLMSTDDEPHTSTAVTAEATPRPAFDPVSVASDRGADGGHGPRVGPSPAVRSMDGRGDAGAPRR